jgi:hypothetical protein
LNGRTEMYRPERALHEQRDDDLGCEALR